MLGSVWLFLKDPTDLAVLGSIGAGIATFAAGAWAVCTFFAMKSQNGPSAPSVRTHHGSVAAGRNITAPVTLGLDEKSVWGELRNADEALRDKFERLAALVARDKGVEVAPVRAVLVKLGEKGVPDEDIPKRLEAAADELIELGAENEQLRRGPTALAAIAEEAQALIDKGEFTTRVARWRVAARPRVPCGSMRAVTRPHSWLRGRGSTICSSPIVPPPRNMPRRRVSWLPLTKSCNGVG
ncbi:MAG: hypothetical protein WCC90_10905 [Methylocella sp.]